MEIFMQNIAFTVTKIQLKTEIAKIVHTPKYAHHSPNGLPLNFEVYILPQRKARRRTPGRQGKLTFPYRAVAEQFLREYGGPTPIRSMRLSSLCIAFRLSDRAPRPEVVESLRKYPYSDPATQEDVEATNVELKSYPVAINSLQFGWECRDNTFSIEWEMDCSGTGQVTFDSERREFKIQVPAVINDVLVTRIVAFRAAQIRWVSTGYDSDDPVIFISLTDAPSFERRQLPHDDLSSLFTMLGISESATESNPPRHRKTAFDDSHTDVAAYTSNTIRLVCPRQSLDNFRAMCRTAHVGMEHFVYPCVRRALFSAVYRADYSAWIETLPWSVAFQLESILRNMLLDLKEVMELRHAVDDLVLKNGMVFTAAFLRHFSAQAKGWNWYQDGPADADMTMESTTQFFDRCLQTFSPPAAQGIPIDLDVFECLHVVVTPTTIRLEGPYPERSNRVIRLFPRDHDSFLRVSFVDENKLQYRYDKEIDGAEFIRARVGGTLRNGLDIAGRHFDFLAYSQSALKEHAVWFVKPFVDSHGLPVTAASIIADLGTFDRVDPKLLFCPARYGARISQAFSATDSSISIDAGEIDYIDDIERNGWCFTDGVGTLSPQLARDIWKELNSKRKRRNRTRRCPSAFQIRFMGSKGMVSVDHQLEGKKICLRPSMIKFEAPNAREIEVARAFDRPGPFNLNRPLVMVLEGLGVPFETFDALQSNAVENAQQAIQSLPQTARLLETYGLGTSYQLTSVMLNLDKLGIEPLIGDKFWDQMMAFGIHHILRELKQHARIPVPNAWNVVGVADVHGYLEKGEIFVHIVTAQGESFCLEGATMVSRSPCIHPGDVQVARAIGRPPSDSPFAEESLPNCIVFSTKGERPLASFLGGGDLDGDLFGVTTLPELLPRQTFDPAAYAPARRHELSRRCTMRDVADFVADYIIYDNLGMIAHRWLLIADQSDQGIHDPNCLKLAELHSDAVDYPKSGRPVPLLELPKVLFRRKPDWDAPETRITANTDEYYPSDRFIGRLYRAIDLPTIPEAQRAEKEQRRRLKREREWTLTVEEVVQALEDELEQEQNPRDDDEAFDLVHEVLKQKVLEYIVIGRHDDDVIGEVWDLFSNYRSQLQTICADHTLSRARHTMLTEEEAVMGTIVAKCSQPRMRRDLMSKLREQTNALVQSVAHQLEGEIGTLPEKSLERAWVAYRMSLLVGNYFGAKSFWWIALKQMFEAMKVMDTENDVF